MEEEEKRNGAAAVALNKCWVVVVVGLALDFREALSQYYWSKTRWRLILSDNA